MEEKLNSAPAQREILFRGLKADGSGEWVYGLLNQYQGRFYVTKEIIEHPTLSDPSGTWIYKEDEVIPETVGQFIGLTDKNGTRIFEGDWIFLCAGYTSKVDFKDGMFISVYSHPEDGEEIPLYDLGTNIEVIGNIHETKQQ